MKKRLLIIGAGGHGKVCADIAFKMNKWEIIEFLDDDENKNEALKFKVIGKLNECKKYIKTHDFFVAIGNNKEREKVHNLLDKYDCRIVNLVHPSTIIGMEVEIGFGCVFIAGSIINSGAKIGNGVIVNTSATIDHDCNIKNFSHIGPGVNIGGTTTIGNRVWLCIGAKITNNIEVTSDCIIGASGVVVKDIVEEGKYIGVPVRKRI